jgi:hypothetical protein
VGGYFGHNGGELAIENPLLDAVGAFEVLLTNTGNMAEDRRGANTSMLTEALEIVRGRYGLLASYVQASGRMMYVVAAERQLRAMPEVNSPRGGLAMFASDAIELARGATTIEALVRRKNPELFHDKGCDE